MMYNFTLSIVDFDSYVDDDRRGNMDGLTENWPPQIAVSNYFKDHTDGHLVNLDVSCVSIFQMVPRVKTHGNRSKISDSSLAYQRSVIEF